MEKKLFETVYQWGRAGIVTDENCNTFQSLINDIKEEAKLEGIDIANADTADALPKIVKEAELRGKTQQYDRGMRILENMRGKYSKLPEGFVVEDAIEAYKKSDPNEK